MNTFAGAMPTFQVDTEVLTDRNPRGGRPQKVGATVWDNERGLLDVKQVQEEVHRRLMLGYCQCGTKVVIGMNRAEHLMSVFVQNGLKPAPIRPSFRQRLGLWLAK